MSGHRKLRILCVSRSTSQLDLIQSQFTEQFEAIGASSPEEAVAFCAANEVAAIVLDSEFVTEDGWTVAQSFRLVKPRLPIVLLNSDHDHEVPPHVDAIASSAELVLGTLKILLRQTELQPDSHAPAKANAYSRPAVMKQYNSSEKPTETTARNRFDAGDK